MAIETTFACEECGREFDQRKKLASHQISHRPPVPCPECGQLIKVQGLGVHMKNVHGNGTSVSAKTRVSAKTDEATMLVDTIRKTLDPFKQQREELMSEKAMYAEQIKVIDRQLEHLEKLLSVHPDGAKRKKAAQTV